MSYTLETGEALITKKGILFKEIYYSGQKALREQWYNCNEDEKVRIIYNQTDTSEIVLADYFEVCKKVEFSLFQGERLKEYYSIMQIYKESRNKFNKHKSRWMKEAKDHHGDL